MHELAIGQSIVSAVSERLPGERVRRLVLEVGQLSGVVPEALRFCFDLCTEGTPVEGAVLEIREIAGLGRCDACGSEVSLEAPFGVCPCGSPALEILRGRELRILEAELA